MLQDSVGTIHLFDLKTVKPNKSAIKDYKETLLRWTAHILCAHPNTNVHSYVAMPYNPQHPKEYALNSPSKRVCPKFSLFRHTIRIKGCRGILELFRRRRNIYGHSSLL